MSLVKGETMVWVKSDWGWPKKRKQAWWANLPIFPSIIREKESGSKSGFSVRLCLCTTCLGLKVWGHRLYVICMWDQENKESELLSSRPPGRRQPQSNLILGCAVPIRVMDWGWRRLKEAEAIWLVSIGETRCTEEEMRDWEAKR